MVLQLMDHVGADCPILTAPEGEPIPKWELKLLERRRCYACGADESTVVCSRPDKLQVAECSKCAAIFILTTPTAEQLAVYYRTYSNQKPYLQQSLKSDTHQYFSVRSALRRFVGRLRRWGFPNVAVSDTAEILARTGGITEKEFIEIGPGPYGGALLEIRSLGASVSAVEIDENAIRALEAMEIRVAPAISDSTATADIIYANMVLEHLFDPRNTLMQIHGKLRPNGRLLVRVPNAGQSKAVGPNWIGFRVDLEHLNYFDSRSLCRVLYETGFDVECIWEDAQPFLPLYGAIHDRRVFVRSAQNALHCSVHVGNDPCASGNFRLSILARKSRPNGKAP